MINLEDFLCIFDIHIYSTFTLNVRIQKSEGWMRGGGGGGGRELGGNS
jgi:hypothetical protein